MGKPTPCNFCGMTLLGPCNHPRCWKRGRVSGEVAHLRAENERLRAALAEIAQMTDEAAKAPATDERWLERIEETACDGLAGKDVSDDYRHYRR